MIYSAELEDVIKESLSAAPGIKAIARIRDDATAAPGIAGAIDYEDALTAAQGSLDDIVLSDDRQVGH